MNRDFTTSTGRINPNFADIAYRGNQGISDYNALAALARYRLGQLMIQGSYTWSHTIDNQSDPLTGDFFNLNFTSISSSGGTSGRATFTQQFNPNVDRGSSDFDQRQNFVLFSYWNLPQPRAESRWRLALGGWTLSEIIAIRSGFPYTVIGTSRAVVGGGLLLNNRPDILNPGQTVFANPTPVAGGEQILNPAGFAEAAPSTIGNEGRNAFTGPGFYSVDLALAKFFPLPWTGEAGRVGVRADFFNAFNHANLGNPNALFTSPLTPAFGVATFGRQGLASGFPAVSPLNETPRQIQLSVRVEF